MSTTTTTTRRTKGYGGYLIRARMDNGTTRWFAYKSSGPASAREKAEKRLDVLEVLEVSHKLNETEWENALANLAALESTKTHNRAGRKVA